MKYVIYALFVILSFGGCEQQSSHLLLMNHAQDLFELQPDSTYILLNTIQNPDKLTDKELSSWCMLYSRAANKLHKELPSRYLLERVSRWYNKNGTLRQQAEIQFYLGRSYVEDKEPQKAISTYLSALDLAEQSKQYDLKGYINSYLGDLYDFEDQPEEARRKYNDAAACFQKTNNLRSYALALRDIAYTWAQENAYETALSYLLKADTLITQTNDTVATSSIYNGLGNIYGMLNDLSTAESYFFKSIELDTLDKASNYLALCDLHLSIGDLPKASFYIEQAMTQSHNEDLTSSILYRQYELAKAQGNINNALLFLEQYQEILYSTREKQNELEVLAVEKRYDNLKLIHENNQLQISKLVYAISLVTALIFCFILFFVYRERSRQKERMMTEQQKKLNQSEIQLLQVREELKEKERTLQIQDDLEKHAETLEQIKLKLQKAHQELIGIREEKIRISSTAKKLKKISQKVIPGKESSPLTTKDWLNIQETVNDTYLSVKKFLKQNSTEFTTSELQCFYLSFFRLDIKEESILLNINPESVGKRHLRVKEKLGIVGQNISIYEFFIAHIQNTQNQLLN